MRVPTLHGAPDAGPGLMVNVGRTTTAIMHGKVTAADLEDWDDEELIHGRRKDKSGGFRGRPPQVVASLCMQVLNRRRFSRAHDLLNDSLVDGALALREIINDKSSPDRVKAIALLFDRVMGQAPAHVTEDVTSTPPWQEMIMASIVGTEAQTQPAPIDVKLASTRPKVVAPDSTVQAVAPAPDKPRSKDSREPQAKPKPRPRE